MNRKKTVLEINACISTTVRKGKSSIYTYSLSTVAPFAPVMLLLAHWPFGRSAPVFSLFGNDDNEMGKTMRSESSSRHVGEDVYEGWMTEGPARTSASATDSLLVIIM